ncbi:cysteine protease StiP family protein [Bacillus sp. DX1.1]|uniref:cysteine protease StiP family protein n=1 Tax=unclassified Bacillus (in: firmicutes) TaxID=185979 RepID=UPI0025701E4E|nr:MULTISPECIES: cysteine protease StiP family protein [unclassified Bacillus (in: firmicutes)]MDM5157079.1 cysteine protease StiP family protein [Bacillus sp. DX1.1]WJE81315.1 cysteine protease StiP family protein [Bacillus sp. DX3.1]
MTQSKSLQRIGSYADDDAIFLLKDISNIIVESSTNQREMAIQSGTHYSEMLPIEYKPSKEYMDLFFTSLQQYKHKLAVAAGVVAEQIVKTKGTNLVLVSLARAGTPIGVLIKRYIRYQYNLDLPHYSMSIIRGRGIDENALQYILQKHPNQTIQFIDGWTGKGAIKKELRQSVHRFNEKHHEYISDCMAVLADPGHCTSIYGTREDFLIPSACLNATVSGLVSRTVLNEAYIGPNDFHGAKYYKELEKEDLSNFFIEEITTLYPDVGDEIKTQLEHIIATYTEPSWQGLQNITSIQKQFEIADINLIKPGVGETTRVLLRRIPWKILIREENNPDLQHILLLAQELNVPIEIYKHMTYSCCGLIQPLRRNQS